MCNNSFEINIEKINSPRLGINESEEAMLGNNKIDLVDRFTYMGSIFSKICRCCEDVKR